MIYRIFFAQIGLAINFCRGRLPRLPAFAIVDMRS